MTNVTYIHQFTSIYPPDEFVNRFTPIGADALKRVGYKAPTASGTMLMFERRYSPTWTWILCLFLIGIILLFLNHSVRTTTFFAEPYEHGSLITIRSDDPKIERVVGHLTVWPEQLPQAAAA